MIITTTCYYSLLLTTAGVTTRMTITTTCYYLLLLTTAGTTTRMTITTTYYYLLLTTYYCRNDHPDDHPLFRNAADSAKVQVERQVLSFTHQVSSINAAGFANVQVERQAKP